jgi:hypothetical protein
MAAMVMARSLYVPPDSGLDDLMARGQREAMPQPDPLPRRTRQQDYERAATAWARYKKMMKWMVLAAIATAFLAVAYLKSFGDPVPFHMVIATLAGVGLSVLVGTGLMGLVFLSNRSGHDDDANIGEWNDDGR